MSKKAAYSIIYEDEEIIVVYKERDVLTIRTNDKATYARNLYHYICLYLRKKNEKPYIVHRLDYETSGLIIFAKNGKMKQLLQDSFKRREVQRFYEAVIEERIDPNIHHDVIQKLDSNNGNKVSISEDGKEAITHITSRNQIQIGTVLDISIETGRRAQIRMAISSLNYHLLGDNKYSQSAAKRMYLNAYGLIFPEYLPLKQHVFHVNPLWLIK